MAEHESTTGASDEWWTPAFIFDAINLTFDLDVASPGLALCHVPARACFTKADDALRQPWHGLVWCNPPYGGRRGQVPWLIKFLDHGDGIGVFRSYTSADWFHEHLWRAHGLLFPRGKTQFIYGPTGEIGRQPGHGIVLVGMGIEACVALQNSGLGIWVEPALSHRGAVFPSCAVLRD